jgi:membrane associated rhomboid family serine protease
MLTLRPKTVAAGADEAPWVSLSLIALNVLVHLLREPDEQAFRDFGFAPSGAGPWTIVTSMFVHASWWHLAGNMLFLWIFGPPVERTLGHGRMLLLYAGADFAGSAFRLVFDGDSTVPEVGASGAISGLMGAYGYLFRRERVDVSFRLFGFFTVASVECSMLTTLVFWALAQGLLWRITVALGITGGTGYGAHVLGFAVGLTVGIVVATRRDAMLAEWRRRHAPDIRCEKCGGPARFAVDDLYRCRACGLWTTGPRPEQAFA